MQAAVLLCERSQQIKGALSELPDTLTVVGYARETYPEHTKLTNKIRSLYTAMLIAVESMVNFLDKSPGGEYWDVEAFRY
jgi:hypothetical protein